jgi:translation initiation factor 6
MVVRLESVLGTAEVGLFAVATDSYIIISKAVNPSKCRVFEEVFQVEPVYSSPAGSILVSPFIAGNSNGLVVSSLVLDEEIREIKRKLPHITLDRLDTKYTAVGNLILCNDKGAIASHILGRESIRTISDILDVEVVPARLAKRSYVGSLAAVTNIGGLVHVEADEDELATISSMLKVDVSVGTVNGGLRYVRSSIVANSNGVIVGSRTTGPELMTITRVFGQ